MKSESIDGIKAAVARYYDISSISELDDSVVIKTQNLDDYPEEVDGASFRHSPSTWRIERSSR